MKSPQPTLILLILIAFGVVWYARAAPLVTGAPPQPQGQITWNQAIASAAVTTSDTTPVSPNPTRALYNGNATACNIAVKLATDAAAVTLQNVQSGEILPLAATFVMATNTTCSNIIALY